ARAFQLLRDENEFLARMRSLGVPLVVAFDRAPPRAGRAAPSSRLVDPDSTERESPLGPEPTAPLVIVRGPEAARVFDSLPAGCPRSTASSGPSDCSSCPPPTRARGGS